MNNSYKRFAYFYDEVMSELDYYSWVDFTLNYLKPNDKIKISQRTLYRFWIFL